MASEDHKGLFITFEGLDGSGKTTQIRRLAAWLAERGHSIVLTRQPGGTPTGDRIRALLLDSRTTGLRPLTELGMMFSDRAQAIAEVIQPALDAGKTVVCDRFTDSSEAYQGGGRELGSDVVLNLHRVLCGNLQPDLSIFLLTDVGASLARARRRAEGHGPNESRFEHEADAFHCRVAAKYREIAEREPGRVVAIECTGTVREVFGQIIEAVHNRLGDRLLVHER